MFIRMSELQRMLPLCVIYLMILTLTLTIEGIVPPKTPVLSGFELAAIGTYRELVCDASQPDAGDITYKWYKYSTTNGVENWESRGPIGKGQKYIFTPVPEKKVFYPGVKEPAAERVSGKYKCRASNSAGTRDSDWGDLFVFTPCSNYTVSVSPTNPAVGSIFTLNCYIHNPSGLGKMWTKQTDTSSQVTDVAVANSKGCHAPATTRYSWSSCSLSSKTNTFNLQVTNAQTSDFAYWICKDINLSCTSNPVKPVVQAHPGTPQIIDFPTGPVIVGAQVNLKCVASPPGDAYDWYKDNTNISTSLTYDFIVKKDSAVYKCVARNTVGSATSGGKTLTVYYKSDSVVISSGKTSCHAGEIDRFICTATGGKPTPILKIYIKRSGGTAVEVTQGQDKVMVKEDNQAKYYCEAKVVGYPALYMTSTRKTYSVTYPPTVRLSLPQKPIKEGSNLTLTCDVTSEGNPKSYTYRWYYKDNEIQHVVTKTYKISAIAYTASGIYKCEAINSGGKGDGTLTIDVHYKPKWNPDLPESFTIASKPGESALKFVLHVIATPSPKKVEWFFSNNTAVGVPFTATKVNETTYSLNKRTINNEDYRNYKVNVSNDVGVSSFVFHLARTGPPLTPCCLRVRNATAISLTLAFKSNFSGGSSQIFNVQMKTAGGAWKDKVKVKEDPGFGNDAIVKIIDLKSDAEYHFKVQSTNGDGDSGYGVTLTSRTKVSADQNGPSVAVIAGGVGGFLSLLIIVAVVLAVVFILKKRQADKIKGDGLMTPKKKSNGNFCQVNEGFNNIGNETNKNGESVELMSPSSSIQMESNSGMVNKKGPKKPPVGDTYADVDLTKKKGGKKKPASSNQGGGVFPKGNKTPAMPAGDEYAQVDYSKKAAKDDAKPSEQGDVYAEVNKPKKPIKPTKPGKGASDDQAVYANVQKEEDIYEDVHDDSAASGYKQPKQAYQVGVDGTLYAEVNIKPPRNPTVIKGSEEIEASYGSVDFSRQAPALKNADDPNDANFTELI